MEEAVRVGLDPGEEVVILNGLTVNNRDFFAVIAAQPESNREQTTLDVIAVGSAAMLRVQTTIDVDFVEKRFGALSGSFERALASFEKEATDSLTKRFSPTQDGSYTKHIAELVKEAQKDAQRLKLELAEQARQLLDPDKKSSAVGKIEAIVIEASKKFEQMFDPNVKTSYAARLNQQLELLFGTDGRAGVLSGMLQESVRPVLKEVQELKEKVEARKAAEQLVDASTLKGAPFEELVHSRLAVLAQPYGDDVAAVGSGNGGTRAGDFVVTVNGTGKRVVVEARDRKQMSLPAIKTELERQIVEREADFALYVSSGSNMLPQHVGDFQFYEDKLVTTIDNLHIAYRLARLLAVVEAPDGQVDVASVRGLLGKMKDAASSLKKVKGKATQVRKLADSIHEDAGDTETQLIELLDEAEQLLRPQNED